MTTQLQQCDRCGGMTVAAYDEVASPDDNGKDVMGRRCVNCGEYVDQLVLQNRGTQQGTVPFPIRRAKRRTPTYRSVPLPVQRRRMVM